VIEDHFSKYLWACPSDDKTAKSVLIAIKTFFSLSGEPKVLQCDNGKEFINSTVENYLKGRNIQFVHGKPYHPQSQGLIERSNRTIQTALARAFHEQKKDFDLSSVLLDILSAYNNNIHSTTKFTPSAAFKLDPEKEKDKVLLTLIQENTKKALKNKLSVVNFTLEQKVLLFNAIAKSPKDDFLRKSNSKKKITKGFLIPALISEVCSDYLVVKISKNYTILNHALQKDEEYKIGFELVQKGSDKAWNACCK